MSSRLHEPTHRSATPFFQGEERPIRLLRVKRCALRLHAETHDRFCDLVGENRVVVHDPVAWRRIVWERLAELLDYPLSRRVGCDIGMDDPTMPVIDDEPHIEKSKSHSRDPEEVHRRDCVLMISKKRHPSLLLTGIGCSFREVRVQLDDDEGVQ